MRCLFKGLRHGRGRPEASQQHGMHPMWKMYLCLPAQCAEISIHTQKNGEKVTPRSTCSRVNRRGEANDA